MVDAILAVIVFVMSGIGLGYSSPSNWQFFLYILFMLLAIIYLVVALSGRFSGGVKIDDGGGE